MIQTFLIATVVFLIAIACMAVGVIVANRRLRGSCGGLAGLQNERGDTLCELCTHPSPDCSGEASDVAEAPDEQPSADVSV